MTVQEVIDFTDRVKPNDFTEEDKTKWISNVCLLYTSPSPRDCS